MRRRIDRDGVRVAARAVVPEERDAGLVHIEHGEIAALCGDVEPTETGIDRQDVGPAARRAESDDV